MDRHEVRGEPVPCEAIKAHERLRLTPTLTSIAKQALITHSTRWTSRLKHSDVSLLGQARPTAWFSPMSLMTSLRGQPSGRGAASATVVAAPAAPAVRPSTKTVLRARRSLQIDCSSEHRCLRAAAAFAAGDTILVLEGLLSDIPSRYSVQVGPDLHVQPAPGIPEDSVRAAWRFLNHSCSPNAAFHGPVLVALAPIAAGEEITFDYNTTEATMAEPFECRCGHCDGRRIGGYQHLSAADRARLHGRVASYLRATLSK